MVMVSVAETYDLSTKTNKMSLIGVHTPDSVLIKKNYPGLLVNCKYFRIVSQDVVVACASMLPADPQQIGTEAGDIAPEDMFNPILYKAVSNDAMSFIESRIFSIQDGIGGSVNGHQAEITNENTISGASDFDEFPVYYALLASHSGFRKAHPQQGLSMTGLRPLVFEQLYSVGVTRNGVNGNFNALQATENSFALNTSEVAGVYRGNAKPMPRMPTTYLTGVTSAGATRGVEYQANGIGDGAPANYQNATPIDNTLPVYTACIIVPPSRLHKLYYRMTIRTNIEFTDIRPVTDVTSPGDAATFASHVYYNDYEDLSKRFEHTLSSVDAGNVDIKQVM